MGAVVSCLQGIGACIMRVIEVIAGVITSIVYGVVDILKAIVAFLTCGYCCKRGGGTTTGTTTKRSHGFRRSRV